MRRDSILILIFLLSSCWFICECRWSSCNNETTYSYGGTYSRNLNQVINDLYRNTSDIPEFSTSSHGDYPDNVYGLLQCVGNISVENCSECSKNAYRTVSENCSNDIGGEAWMDDCFLRYDNYDFFSEASIGAFSLPNDNYVPSNLEDYEATVTNLLKNLSEKAYESANKGFAVGSANYTTSGKVYGLVQCWRVVLVENCKKCLISARQEGEKCCLRKKGARLLGTNCKIRHETYPFFGSAESMSPEGSTKPTEAHSSERRGYSPEARLIIQEKHFVFSLEELAESTQNFDENKKLGVGGFGAVYKGTTRDGKEITVKKLSARSTQGRKEFMNEVKLLANVQHRNLVKLLGCCAEEDETLLVYEYFPNKSLDTFLFDPEKRRELSW
ncbi:cysteine-rich receptor-like protein kinase 24 isoform X1 [Cryptomeria japonica]|uniref:cysteine-rich receptor-like protein kinase 24 isoform X1 n=1 Tax=Cryptomeria japonica TaxID=3369 RepID=UPI0027D9F72B|nr:cysteine-rich receptor-like protein kinase 24 isoform X1 [Cryptomeria japonica]